jgi:hypothetical protein
VNLPKLHLILFIALNGIPLSAQSIQQKEYRVEVIFFEQLENTSQELFKPEILNITDLQITPLQNEIENTLNADVITKSFKYKKDSNILDDMQSMVEPSKEIDETNSAPLDKPRIITNRSKWFVKNKNLIQLDNIQRRLDRRKEYKVLHSISWLQPALDKDNSPYIYQSFKKNGFLVKLYQSRYLHLDVIGYLGGILNASNNYEMVNFIKLNSLKKSIPDDVEDLNIKFTPEMLIDENSLVTIIRPTNSDQEELITESEVRYLLREDRRIFKNESHYFDHPKLGMIIAVYDSSL